MNMYANRKKEKGRERKKSQFKSHFSLRMFISKVLELETYPLTTFVCWTIVFHVIHISYHFHLETKAKTIQTHTHTHAKEREKREKKSGEYYVYYCIDATKVVWLKHVNKRAIKTIAIFAHEMVLDVCRK